MQKTREIKDSLLECLVWLSKHYERPRSHDALVAGLSGYEGTMSANQFIHAGTRAGLASRKSKKNITKIEKRFFPIVAFLKNNSACIITKKIKNDFEVVMPEMGDGVSIIKNDELQKIYTGELIYVQPMTTTTEKFESFLDSHWFWTPLAKNWNLFANLLIASFLTNLFALTTPLFIKIVYDRVVPNNALETLAALAIGAGIIFIFDFLIRSLRGYFVELAGQKADAAMSGAIFEQVMNINFNSKPSKIGVFANRLREFEAVREFFTTATITALVDLPFIIFYILVIYFIAGNLAIVPLAATIFVLGIGLIIHLPLSKIAKKSTEDAELRHALLIDSITGLETIKLSGAAGRFQGLWNRIAAATAKRASKSRLFSNFAINITITASQVAGIIIVVLGVIMISKGELTAGTLIAVVILNGRAVGSLGQVASLLVRLNQAWSAYQSLNQIMQLPTERPIEKNFINRSKIKGRIEFKNVTFSYPGRTVPVLRDVSFSIPQGSSVGLIGRIGSGKTTILRLILNLYKPDKGSILIDGIDSRQIDPVDLRKNIGASLQDAYFFNGSIRENLVLGQMGTNDEHIEWAMKLTNLDKFVSSHPHGLDLMIGERGEALSNGQRQALVLTRTFLRDPPILLLDEPTSMMDSPTETHIQKTIRETFPDRTLILVTHRASLIESVNHLLVIDEGKIAAQGPRDEVLEAIKAGKVNTYG